MAIAKKTIAMILVCLLAMLPFTAFASGGDMLIQAYVDPDIDPNPNEDFESIAVSAQLSASLPAKSAILMEQTTGKVLYEMNADVQIPPASVTKIMTLLLTMEALESGKINIDDMVPTSEYANSMGGSQIWLKVGEEMSVDDLLKAVTIASANDASAALGEYIAGSNDGFVEMMNQKAKQLGMVNTHFENATGLDAAEHLTTARDIAIMSRELIRHPKIAEYSTIWMDSLRGGATELVNTNKLVRFYNGATGLKTGTTDGAGSCLSATAERDGLSLIAVVMGCPTSNDRFASARGLLDFGFANYQAVTPPALGAELTPVPVLRGVEDSVMPVSGEPQRLIIEKGQEDTIRQEITLVSDIEAPVVQGQVIGKVQVLVDGAIAGEYNLTASTEIERMTFTKAFIKLGKSMLRMNRAEKPAAFHQPATAGETTAGAESKASPEQSVCTCEPEKCYCEEIGDICGCTKAA